MNVIISGRPARATYLGQDFAPVDDPALALFIDVKFIDARKGTMVLAREQHDGAVLGRAWRIIDKFDPDEPRDESGRWTSGGGGDGGGEREHPGEGYTKDAYVKGGVIYTSSVNDAARALSEDRKVELDQPRKISVLLKKLGKIAEGMIKQGKDAPVFDLCKVTVKDTNLFCAESKGIPRIKMPQMDADQTKAFITHLKDKGYSVKKEIQWANHLRATQNQLNGAKVAGIAEKMRDSPKKYKNVRLVVSKDDYILDGHHRWAGQIGIDSENNKLTNGKKMKISRVNISITKLLEEANKFTGGKGAQTLSLPLGPCEFCGGVEMDEETRAWEETLKYDPNEPRIPGGGPGGGQWTSGGGSEGGAASGPHIGELLPTDQIPYPGRRHGDVHPQSGRKINDIREDPKVFANKPITRDVDKINSILMLKPVGGDKFEYNRVWEVSGAEQGKGTHEILSRDEHGNVHRQKIPYSFLGIDPHPDSEIIPHSAPRDIREQADKIINSVKGARRIFNQANAKLGRPDSHAQFGPYTKQEEEEMARLAAEKWFPAGKMEAAKPKPGQRPVLDVLAGSGGSGKSSFSRPTSEGGLGLVDDKKAIHINSDDITENLKDYEGWNANLLYPRGSATAIDAVDYVASKKLNTVLDTTFNNPTVANDVINKFKDAGYEVRIHFMEVSPQKSAERAVQRAMITLPNGKPGRVFPLDTILQSRSKETFEKMKALADSWDHYNNEEDQPLAASGHHMAPKFVARS